MTTPRAAPTMRLIKDRLYRNSFQSWDAYVMSERRGCLPLFSPAGTHVFDSSGWFVSPYSWQTLVIPGAAFVPHLWRRPDGYGFYVDVVRRILIQPAFVLWEDLYIDLLITDGAVSEKDEDDLATAPVDEAAHARRVRDEIRMRVGNGDPVFDPDSDLWQLPDDRLAPPSRREALGLRP